LAYIDLVLLNAPTTSVTKSKVNRQLQDAITESMSARERKENGDVLTWIFATASATFGSTSKQKAALVDKFKVALLGLEARVMTKSGRSDPRHS
jgi:hypothetical protein